MDPFSLSTPDFLGDALLADAADVSFEVPRVLDTLPDGREVVVIGDVKGAAAFNHAQGDNPWNVKGDCGIVSCENVLDQFGIHLTESDVLGFASILGLCDVSSDPNMAGGTSPLNQVSLLALYGVPAHFSQGTMLDLAMEVESGHGVIAEVNAGQLWGDAQYFGTGEPNHAVNVSGVALDPKTGALAGFYINDSGNYASGKFVSVADFQAAWAPYGQGAAVVTDGSRLFPAQSSVPSV